TAPKPSEPRRSFRDISPRDATEEELMGRVENKVALITGAARGQGRSHAIRLAEEGADIIAVDLCDQIDSVPYGMSTPDDLAETARLVEALDRRISIHQADVRDLAQMGSAVQAGIAQIGPHASV